MRHADHDLADFLLPGALDEVIEHRYEALTTLEREALLADVLRVQVALDALGVVEALEYGPLLSGAELPITGRRLETFPDPQAFAGSGQMRKLRPDLAAIHSLEQRKNLAQRHSPTAAPSQAACEKLRIHVGLIQAEIVELEHGRHMTLP